MRFAVVLALLVVLAGAVVGVATGQPAVPETGPLHFDHARHKERGLKIDEACGTCHQTDAKGTISPPAKSGHAPCLNGACHNLPGDKPNFTHASWFIATGPTAKAKHPTLFAQATRFCLGCHDGTEAPAPSSKPTTSVVLQAFQSQREFHITMTSDVPGMLGHFTHVQSAGGQCTGCHTVGGKTDVTPGHAQCQTCHSGESKALHPMSDCGKCHVKGGRAAAFPEDSRSHTDVRQCGSEGHLQWAKRQHLPPDKVACFSHDKPGHQHVENNPKEPLECGKCHAWIVDKKLDLPALHATQVIPNGETEGHAICAGCHHHSADVHGSGKACLKCHADHARKEFQ